MSVSDFVPSVLGLGRVLQRAAFIANDEDIIPRVYIASEFRQSSFEFFLTLEQIVPAAISLFQSDGGKTAIEVISKVFGGAGSLLDLMKRLHGAKKEDVTRTTLRDGSVQYNINVQGENNRITVIPLVARLEQDVVVREALEPAIEPLLRSGVDEVQFRPSPSGSPSVINKEEASFFLTRANPKPIDDSFQIVDRLLTVVKPSFVERRRWKFRDGDLEFGAAMDDYEFQRKVTRRELLFGNGDQLHVKLAIRLHRAKMPEYRVQKVLEIIRPGDPPMQLDLAQNG